jgi:hypothetical protein
VESPFNIWDYILGPIYFIGLQIYYFQEDFNAWLNGAIPMMGDRDENELRY